MNKISIITVCYNSAKTIEQTIQSVINQSYKNVEYIIIDGASTDGTQRIIEKYIDRIAYYVSEPDGGIYDAMNKGIQKATGDIVGIINSDDWYEEGIFEKVNTCFENNKIDVLYGKINCVDENQKKRERVPRDISYLRYAMCICHQSVFMRKSIHDTYGLYSTSYRIASDYELLLKLYEAKVAFYYLEEVIAYFRRTGTCNRFIYDTTLETFQIAFENAKKNHIPDSQRDSILNMYKWRLPLALCRDASCKYAEEKTKIEEKIKLFWQNKDLVIFGVGEHSELEYNVLATCGVPVNCIVDNNSGCWGTLFHEISVENPEILKDYVGSVLIATQKYGEEIKKQICSYNNSRLKIYTVEEYWGIIGEEFVSETLKEIIL